MKYHNPAQVRLEPKLRRVKPEHSSTFKAEAQRLAARHGIHVRISEEPYDALLQLFIERSRK